MTILIYSGEASASLEQLQKMIKDRFEDRAVELRIGVRQLAETLRNPFYDVDAAVILANGKQDLDDLFDVGEILCSLPVIVILPNTDRDLVSTAHKLQPRFVTTPRQRFQDVVHVLEKTVERSERLRREGWA